MLQRIDGLSLIPGEFYFIRSPFPRANIGKARFVRYINDNAIFHTYFGNCSIQFDLWILYRYVSHDEYKQKLKDHFDSICVNIVLKRLIDDSFTW
jgi:hypothetical protein